MTDIDLSSPISIDDSPCRSQINQTFTTSSIENMLKRKDNRKEFTVIENNQKKSSSAWATFGFPARLSENGTYERIHGFASCFQCKTTYTFHSDGSGSTKHLLRHICAKSALSSEHYYEGPLDKLFKSKKTASVTLNSKDSTKIKDDLTKWICTSIRPFNMVEDPGRKYQDLDSSQLLVTPTTISKNVHQLAEQYRSLLQPILIQQAANSCLCLCPDLWTDKYRKVNYLGLTAVFTDKNYELILLDLCCCEYQEVDKSGDSVLQAIRRQLDLYGLTSYMDNNKIVFTCDRGPNILKALKGKFILTPTTPTTKEKKSKTIIQSSSDDTSSEDEIKSPSPSKYIESNTSLSELTSKASELLGIITTSKQLVKYVKLTGLNKSIQDAGGLVLKQSTIVRWLSLSNLLESIDLSYEHLRLVLSKSTNNKQTFKLNKINVDGLKDLICLLSVFKDVCILVQTGTRPSLHMAYIAMNKLERHLSGTDVDENGESITIDDRHEGTEFFRRRLLQLLRTMFTFDEKHLSAAVLHPLYRRLTFASAYSKTIAHSYIRQQIDEILGLNSQEQMTLPEPSKKKHKSMEDQFADPDEVGGIDGIDMVLATTVKNDELDKYLRMNIEDIYKQPNPLPFWKHHQHKFPCLSLLARRLFSIPVTSAAVERSFSAAGLAVTERRSSLDPDTVNDILFVRSIQNLLERNPDFFS
ncbi:unnamed protein product [Rotaria sordida]|uniref:HAT C-terminal dimerisation domain-containing protein n=1 Tax=Rotaria sordida TaxID=392033 RepID=A0A819UTQ9_9BILA|nr:unnamed protein product [Rotaria sordida]